MLIKILTASGYAAPHFANVPVLSVMTTQSLNQKPIRGGREEMNVGDENRNTKLTFSTEFVFFACSTSFLQTIIADKPIEEKKKAKNLA